MNPKGKCLNILHLQVGDIRHMKKVDLSMKEEKTYQIIKKIVDNGVSPKTKKKS